MELTYKGPNKLRRELNEIAAGLFILYAVAGSSYNSVNTGHLSADIATGISHPTVLEQIIMDFANKHFSK